MKKLILFLCFLFVSLGGFAKDDFLPNPDQIFSGDTIFISNTSVCNGGTVTLSILSFFGFETSCSYSCDGVSYYTTEPAIVLTFNVPNDTTFVCYIDSMNGESMSTTMAISISVMHAPTVSIDSVHHVTCPDGYLYPYADGSFYVNLCDSVQNYAWITVGSDSSFFYEHTYYDDFSITGLRSGTYHVVVHGSNGCMYTDSVTITQPEPWINHIDQHIIDTIKCGNPAYVDIVFTGGTGDLSYFWVYEDFDSTINYPDTSSLYFSIPGQYYVRVQDSLGCLFGGFEWGTLTIYEFVVDTIHMQSHDTILCHGEEIILSAYSRGFGNHTWSIGDYSDSINYYTGIYPDIGYVAEYLIDTLTQPQYVSVTFVDQNGCETSDSIWVDVYDPDVSLTIDTTIIVIDSTCTIHVSPSGGNLYLDDILIAYNIPEDFTFSTDGISVGEHMLKYSGIFGEEVGLSCEDEISLPIQVEINPFVPNWEYNISIYPNPATNALNLSSTEQMDFTATITDVTGKVIRTENVLNTQHAINISNLSSGIYLLRLQTPTGATKTVKFVKREM